MVARASYSISLVAPQQLLDQSISRQAIDDCIVLLQDACHCEVTLNNPQADVVWILPAINSDSANQPNAFSQGFDYPYLQYPNHYYTWQSYIDQKTGRIHLSLETPSFQGVSFGLYGLMQEQLGFLFVHPRQTVVPNLESWPLPQNFTWKATPRFDKKGFHLHTQHPLELTEQLLDETQPNALADVKQYIDWLARNGQNYFEFNLLEGINRKNWPAHAKAFVEYGQSRGIIMGVDVSLHMVQQKAFMLYVGAPKSFKGKKKQIKENLAWLFQAPWNVINMEFSTTEFTEGDPIEKEELRLFIIDLIKNTYGAKLMGREHVVKKDEMVMGGETKTYEKTEAEKELDSHRGILIHTVMFYTATEEKAPVYQNENLRHMLDKLHEEIAVRETWYYPESAYWITFDNSVPMFLLPYLSGRLDDINTMDSLGVPGHITFSSGWEWGYWLIDYSIARWCWESTFTTTEPHQQIESGYTPVSFIQDVFEDKQITNLFNELHYMQVAYFKDQELMRYMAASTVTDEMPAPINLEFQPRPRYTYRYLGKKASLSVLDSIRKEAVIPLADFSSRTIGLLEDNSTYIQNYINTHTDLRGRLLQELVWATQIVAWRASHRSATLAYLLGKRQAKLDSTRRKDYAYLLDHAISIRCNALEIVHHMERGMYRYPVELIGRRMNSHTAYNFGYLFPVSYLHFWKREELQARKLRYGPFYRNIYNIPRIIGVVD